MAKLSNSARLYCEIHGIPSDRLFDAEIGPVAFRATDLFFENSRATGFA
jgi:hypothetical protein